MFHVVPCYEAFDLRKKQFKVYPATAEKKKYRKPRLIINDEL